MEYTEAKKQQDKDFIPVKSFCEYLDDNGYELTSDDERIEIKEVLYQYFGIDGGKLEVELRHMLSALSKSNP